MRILLSPAKMVAEDLLAGDAHVSADAGEDRRIHEVATIAPAVAAESQRRALPFAELDVAADPLELRG
ncbi:hypothetical protein [Mycobacterium timonense]|uniref:hypothetical protein n=1 Tax=Mycobacterium timonense TaxID=701043 RepID=UPI0023EA5D7F|nr:hypothetical protein [Mycobacterium timonense]